MKTLSQLTFLDTLLQSGPDFPALEELIDTALAIYTHAHRHTDTHTHTNKHTQNGARASRLNITVFPTLWVGT